jgi:hypothetical protein
VDDAGRVAGVLGYDQIRAAVQEAAVQEAAVHEAAVHEAAEREGGLS